MTAIETGVQIGALLILFTTAVLWTFSAMPWLALIPGIATISYWLMIHDRQNMEMYRYANWALTTPLMLAAILLQNNVTNHFISIVLILDFLMIGAGYFGVKEKKNPTKKLFWFLLGLILFTAISYVLFNMPIEKTAAMFTIGLWALYPIVWICKSNFILRDDETNMAYSFLDVASKVGLLNLIRI